MFPRVSLDANGNERQRKVKKKSLTGNTLSSHAAPSLGVFARTLFEKANEDTGGLKDGDDNDDDLSPNSIRQLMFFHPRSNPNLSKPVSQLCQEENITIRQKKNRSTIFKTPLNDTANTVTVKPREETEDRDHDDEMSPKSVRKLIFPHHRSAIKPVVSSSSQLFQPENIPSSKKKVDVKTNHQLSDSWNIDTESVQGKSFLIIKTLGKGGSGEVFLVVEKEQKNLFAMKKVRFAGINECIIRECVNEITMLQELKNTELVIRIDCWEINKVDNTMKIIMEYGHSDLGTSLKVSKFSLQEVRSTWESILKIVSIIHARGIVHADLKPANFVWVGHRLKIIDFGIASRIQNDNTSIVMLNPKGTVNYISPETISPDSVTGKLKISPKSDIWSIGCILYLMVYGSTPFHAYKTYVSKVAAIINGIVHYPPLPPEFEGSGVDSVLKLCFMKDHHQRPAADELLRHRFLAGPLALASHSQI